MEEPFASDLNAVRRTFNSIDAQPGLLSRKECAFIRSFIERHTDTQEGAPPGIDEITRHETDESTDDEDEAAPPETLIGDDELRALNRAISTDPSCRAFTNRGALHLDRGLLDSALADAERAVELNPDSARALRLRARTKHMLDDNAGAFADMSDAQRIDYSEEFEALHSHMRIDKEGQEVKRPLPSTIPNIPQDRLDGFDLSALMGNEAFVNMAQNMMSNPEFMKSVFSDMQKSS